VYRHSYSLVLCGKALLARSSSTAACSCCLRFSASPNSFVDLKRAGILGTVHITPPI
jgi:hypothetical protein